MACYHPLSAFQTESGEVVFAERGRILRSLFLPCGQCIGCKLERSRQWAVRCVHESKLYDENCFITLTYDDEHLPPDGGLRYPDYQDFMKRLRKRFEPQLIRFYMCGEYGEGFDRPHYHAILFNFNFRDKLYFKREGDSKLFTSRVLNELWPFGFSLIGSMSFESAAYISRYCTKKITGARAEDHYKVVRKDTGEILTRSPEFNRMSLKPGIGAPWLERFMTDVYPKGEVITNGRTAKPPRYYDKVFEKLDTDDSFARMMFQRKLRADKTVLDNTQDRLNVKEQVALARIKSFKRTL